MVKQINIGGVSFNQEFIQPAAIGTSKDPKQLSITYEENKDNPSNPDNVMIIQAQEVQNISSYLIGMNGTMKVISKRFESITQEVRNRIKESGTLIETIQNYKSGIFGTNIELEIEETPIISGTDIKALESLKIKARQLAIREAQNKHFEEHRVVKEKTFSKSESHSIISTTQAIQTRISAPKIEIETEDNIDMIAPIIEGEDVSIVSKNGDVNIEDTKNKLLSYNYSYEEKTDLTSIIVSGATAALGSTVLVLLGMVPRELGVLTVTVSGVTGAFISLLENNQIAKEIIRKNHDEIIIKANINAKNLKIIAANKLLLPYQDAIIADNKDIRAFAGIKRYRLELVHELKEEINKSGTDYGLAIITGLISSGLVTCFIRSAFVPTITLSDSNGNSNTQPQLPFEFDSQDKNKSIEDDEDTLTISKNTINNNQITFLQNNPLLASNTTMPLPRVTDIETINQVRQLFEAAGIALLAGDTILVPAIAAVGGTYMLYRGGRLVANVVRKRKEVKQQQRAIGYSNQTTTASPNPLPPRRDDEEESKKKKEKSINQIQRDIEKRKDYVPKEVTRLDKGLGNFEQNHIHFGDDIALNFDGTMKHGSVDDLRRVLTNDGKKWLKNIGVKLPPNL